MKIKVNTTERGSREFNMNKWYKLESELRAIDGVIEVNPSGRLGELEVDIGPDIQISTIIQWTQDNYKNLLSVTEKTQ